jgi:hypothetical protein
MLVRSAALAVLFVAPFYAQAPAKPAAAAAALPDGREIVNRHIKEIGGREAVTAGGTGVRDHRSHRDIRRD